MRAKPNESRRMPAAAFGLNVSLLAIKLVACTERRLALEAALPHALS